MNETLPTAPLEHRATMAETLNPPTGLQANATLKARPASRQVTSQSPLT